MGYEAICKMARYWARTRYGRITAALAGNKWGCEKMREGERERRRKGMREKGEEKKMVKEKGREENMGVWEEGKGENKLSRWKNIKEGEKWKKQKKISVWQKKRKVKIGVKIMEGEEWTKIGKK